MKVEVEVEVKVDPMASIRDMYSKMILQKMTETVREVYAKMQSDFDQTHRCVGDYCFGPIVFDNVMIGQIVDGKIQHLFFVPEKKIEQALADRKATMLRQRLHSKRTKELFVSERLDVGDVLQKLLQ